METQTFFTQEYNSILRFHRAGGSGIDVSFELTELLDRSVTNAWSSLPEEFHSSSVVVALGSYGRYEMSPHSDVDIMLLFEDEKTKTLHTESAQKFLHALWNFGFEIGHSVRTIEKILELYQAETDVWASLLESRYVCGSKNILQVYAEKMLSFISSKPQTKFLNAILNGVEERHKKYEHSIKLLEPNIKNSAGGLRDLHSLFWIYRATHIRYFGSPPFFSTQSGIMEFFNLLLNNNVLAQEEFHELTAAFTFLLRMRHELHYTTNSQQDILEFNRQFVIAHNLGYKSEHSVRPVECCMREYYLNAKLLYRLNRRLLTLAQKEISAVRRMKPKEVFLDDLFIVRNEELCLKNPSFTFTSPAQIVKAFYWCSVQNVEIHPLLTAQIEMVSHTESFFHSTKEDDVILAEIFLDILRLPSRVAQTLQALNEYGILGKILPEWGELVAFFQHSAYHYYTTDAHTLIALEHAENLLNATNVLGDVFRRIPKKEILYLAILFHDIAKPSGIEEHEIRGVDVWKKVQERFTFSDERHDVAFLIRNHLAMEQIAFRRNIGDQSTIDDFARMFYRPEQLDLLFILTYADLSAVNKTVWTSWKEMLLQELYVKTHKHILQKQTENEEHVSPFSKEELAEIERYSASQETFNVIFKNEKAHSGVTIITRDAPSLLSTLCGVLSANDVNIFDASIFTQENGIVIDSFRVVDAATKQALTQQQETAIQHDLENILEQRETLDALFENHRRRWKRRAKPLVHPNIRIDAVFHQTEKHTIIDIYGPDMVGFLYKITQTLSKAHLQIDFARLATRGDGIVDSFYVRNGTGKRIESEEQQKDLRKRILHTIDLLMNVQLETRYL